MFFFIQEIPLWDFVLESYFVHCEEKELKVSKVENENI